MAQNICGLAKSLGRKKSIIRENANCERFTMMTALNRCRGRRSAKPLYAVIIVHISLPSYRGQFKSPPSLSLSRKRKKNRHTSVAISNTNALLSPSASRRRLTRCKRGFIFSFFEGSGGGDRKGDFSRVLCEKELQHTHTFPTLHLRVFF